MMIQRLLVVWTWIAVMWWMPNALADVRVCTKQEAREAESVAATAKSWQQLHRQFQHYAHCDDGAIAEGFSESVSILLAEHWKNIGQLEAILKSDLAFRKFVIRHIDDTVPSDRLEHIAKNAGKRCRQNLKKLCRDIETAASKK